jgi:hypothetical protein
MPVVPNLEKERHGDKENIAGWLKSFVCIYLYILHKEEGVCGFPRSASSLSLNRPTLKMEKQRGAVNISIREDEAYSVGK